MNHDDKQPDSTTGRADDKTDALLESIAQTRNDMGDTIQELHGRLNPAVLKEQALEQFREAKESVKEEVKAEFHSAASSLRAEMKAELEDAKSKIKEEFQDAKAAVREATIGKVENMVHNAQDTVRTTSSSVVDVVRANPIPAALAGFGLAWLIMSARRNPPRSLSQYRTNGSGDGIRARIGGTGPEAGAGDTGALNKAYQRVAETAGQVGDKIQQTAGGLVHDASDAVHKAESAALATTQQVGRTIGGFAGATQDRAMRLAHDASEQARHLAHDAGEQAMRLEERAETTYHENPIAVGIALVALGTAVGLAIPITRREDTLMGPARDQVVGKVQELAHDALGTVQQVAQHAADDATQALKDGTAAKTLTKAFENHDGR